MRLLLDTHLLLWAAAGDGLSKPAQALILEPANRLYFSAASIWEVAIKLGLNRPDFKVEPSLLRRGLLDAGYEEIPITGAHTAALVTLPDLHKDPFDRILVCQAIAEGAVLLTSDEAVARYPGPIRLV